MLNILSLLPSVIQTLHFVFESAGVLFLEAAHNPFSAKLTKQITIRLDEDYVGYFKQISEQVGIPYQSLINVYLRDCAT